MGRKKQSIRLKAVVRTKGKPWTLVPPVYYDDAISVRDAATKIFSSLVAEDLEARIQSMNSGKVTQYARIEGQPQQQTLDENKVSA